MEEIDKNFDSKFNTKLKLQKNGVMKNLMVIPILLWLTKKTTQETNRSRVVLDNVTYYMYKNEKNIVNLEENSYNLQGDDMIIYQDSQLKNTNKTRYPLKSMSLKIYELSNKKEVFIKKWFKESPKQIKYFSTAISENYLFIILDFTDMHGYIKKTSIERIEFNDTNFVQRVHIDDIDSKNCTRSVYIPSQKLIARLCTDGYRIILRRNLVQSSTIEDTIITVVKGKKLNDFRFIIMPTNDPQEIKYLIYEIGTDDVVSIVSNRFITRQFEKIGCSFRIKEMFYIGNMILLIKTFNDEIHFKEIVFGSFTELEKWKYLSSEGSYVNSYFSLKERSLIVEILNVVRKDQIIGKKKIQDFDIIAFKYDKNAKSFALFKRWMPKRDYDVLSNLKGTTFKKISRINSQGYIISMIQEEFVTKTVGQLDEKPILKNISLVSSSDYSLNYKPNKDVSIDSFADEIINVPSSEAYISFFKDSFNVHSDGSTKFKKCMMRMDILQKPKALVGWNITSFPKEKNAGVLFNNVSFWTGETMGTSIPGSKNYTFVFKDSWEDKQNFIWEETNNNIGSYTVFTGIPNRLDMINYVRGSFIARQKYDTKNNTALPNLQGENLYAEKDFEKINDLMMLTFLSSVNSRMNFYNKNKVHRIDTLFSLGFINSKKKESFIIIRKYRDETAASIFEFKPNQHNQTFVSNLKEHGPILKVAQYDDKKFIFLRKGGRVFLFDTSRLVESELNFPGKPCRHMFFIQHSKIKLTLLCVEDDLKISLYYADELISGWTSKSSVSIAKHQIFKKAVGLTHKDVNVLVSQEFTELIYIFAKDQPNGKPNMFIYEVSVGITVEVLGKKELEITAVRQNSTESNGKLFDYKIVDTIIAGRYFIMLLREADETIWVSVKMIEGGTSLIDMKLVKLDYLMRLEPRTKMVIIDNYYRGILSRQNMSPLVAFRVMLNTGAENVVIFDPDATVLESIPFMLLPDDEEMGIQTFPVYCSSIKKTSRSIGVVRYHHFKEEALYLNNLVHIFKPLPPSVQIKGTANLDINSIFQSEKERNINESLFFVNYLNRHKNHDSGYVKKNVKYNYVEGDKELKLIKSGVLSPLKNITKKIDLRGFTNPKTGEVDKETYVYKYKINEAIKGNIISTNFTSESLLEQVSEMIKFYSPVSIKGKVNVNKVTSKHLRDILNDKHREPVAVNKQRMKSLSYTCVDGEIKNFTKAFIYECYSYSLVYLSNERMVSFASRSFKIPRKNSFISRIKGENFIKKVDIKNSDKIILNFEEFKRCSNIVPYRRYVVTICQKMGSMRIDIVDTVSLQL